MPFSPPEVGQVTGEADCCVIVQIYQSVKELYEADSFIDGEVLKQGSNVGPERVRSDRITWVDENYSQCMAVRHLCKKLDRVVKLCIAHSPHEIEARTKVEVFAAMLIKSLVVVFSKLLPCSVLVKMRLPRP